VPRAAMTWAMSVAGRPSLGVQRSRIAGWKNSAMACWTVVMVLAAVRSSPWIAPWRSPCQCVAAWGCSRRMSAGSAVP